MFVTIFKYLPFLFVLLAFLFFILPLKVKVRTEAIFLMVLLICASKFCIFEALGGNTFVPEFSEHVIWVWNWATSGLFLLVPISIFGLFLPRTLRLFLVPILAWSLSARGVYNGLKLPDAKEIVFESSQVSDSLSGYRIVHISDLHISSASRAWRTKGIVEKVNALNPDLIVITGDIVDGTVKNRLNDVEPLKDLKAKDGVLCCTGNHEYYNDWLGWQPYYKKWGLRFLETNSNIYLNENLLVAGITDFAAYTHHGEYILPNDNQIFGNATNGVFCLLLQHRPSYGLLRNTKSDNRVSLQLSGHTHGGVAPGLDLLTQVLNQGFLKGLQPRRAGEKDFGYVYTSPGTGQWAGFPIRFFNDSEISVITLRKARDTSLKNLSK